MCPRRAFVLFSKEEACFHGRNSALKLTEMRQPGREKSEDNDLGRVLS